MSPPEADAAQATCREYNVTSSGLAYCDSEVGTGITATKGMLIKVPARSLLCFLCRHALGISSVDWASEFNLLITFLKDYIGLSTLFG